ncbi:hypothetical protein RHMOL_Rhmol09G0018800 [Rhododendron molle]|uniref:Uncharacterized protein n=1 Tax=Rhododendron molle TaxID=49168 RepID=A0ACC0M8Z5_RHOML|nr:hypothetical protein RHMOL_Rhmol09G0018800 [Rhododendron molle]
MSISRRVGCSIPSGKHVNSGQPEILSVSREVEPLNAAFVSSIGPIRKEPGRVNSGQSKIQTPRRDVNPLNAASDSSIGLRVFNFGHLRMSISRRVGCSIPSGKHVNSVKPEILSFSREVEPLNAAFVSSIGPIRL